METVLCVLHDEDMMEKLVCLQNEVYQERGLHFNKDFFRAAKLAKTPVQPYIADFIKRNDRIREL